MDYFLLGILLWIWVAVPWFILAFIINDIEIKERRQTKKVPGRKKIIEKEKSKKVVVHEVDDIVIEDDDMEDIIIE